MGGGEEEEGEEEGVGICHGKGGVKEINHCLPSQGCGVCILVSEGVRYPCYVSHGTKSQLQMLFWESWPSGSPCLYIHDKNPLAKVFPAGNG